MPSSDVFCAAPSPDLYFLTLSSDLYCAMPSSVTGQLRLRVFLLIRLWFGISAAMVGWRLYI